MTYSAAILADSPILFYDLLTGTLTDQTGNGHTATSHGGPVFGSDGLTFDGIDDYLDCASPGLSGLDHYSIEFRLSVPSFANDDHILCEYSADYQAAGHAFAISPNNNGVCGASNGFGQGESVSFGSFLGAHYTRPSAVTLHKYVFLFDRRGPSGPMAAYFDGSYQNTFTDQAGGTLGSQTLYIMSRAGTSLFLAGTLSHFAVFGTVLTGTQITTHNDAPISASGGAYFGIPSQ